MQLTLEILTPSKLTPLQMGNAVESVSVELRDGSASGTIMCNGEAIGTYLVQDEPKLDAFVNMKSTDPEEESINAS